MNLNKVILIGRLTRDPELRSTSSGRPVANFSIATNRYWTNDSGERQEETEFHNIVVWGRQAEIVEKFLNKGSLAMVEGRLQTRDWEDRDGNSRRTTEVVAQRVQFGPKASNQMGDGMNQPPAKGQSKPKKGSKPSSGGSKGGGDDEDDIPEIEINEEGEEIDPEDIPF